MPGLTYHGQVPDRRCKNFPGEEREQKRTESRHGFYPFAVFTAGEAKWHAVGAASVLKLAGPLARLTGLGSYFLPAFWFELLPELEEPPLFNELGSFLSLPLPASLAMAILLMPRLMAEVIRGSFHQYGGIVSVPRDP